MVAEERMTPDNDLLPAFAVIEGGQGTAVPQSASAPLASLVNEIRWTCRQRDQLLRAEIALSNQEFANFCLLNPDDPKCKRRDRMRAGDQGSVDTLSCGVPGSHASGDHMTAETPRAIVAAEAVEGGRDDIAARREDASLTDFVSLPLIEARAVLTAHRKPLEKRMEKLAKQLPVWPWVESVRGFGAASLAQIIGETGDLSNYDNPAKVWKRMGLAVMDDGQRQRRVAGAAAIEHGYVPRRRSVMYVIGDVLIKSNRDGAYRTLYLARKEYEKEQHPEMSAMAHHRRAQRYMEKRLLRDLWRAWRSASDATAVYAEGHDDDDV